jgi:hypothetical protein
MRAAAARDEFWAAMASAFCGAFPFRPRLPRGWEWREDGCFSIMKTGLCQPNRQWRANIGHHQECGRSARECLRLQRRKQFALIGYTGNGDAHHARTFFERA